MRRILVTIALLLTVGTPLIAAESERELVREFPVPPGKGLEVALKVGELQVETANTDTVRFEIEARCRAGADEKCLRRLAKLDIESSVEESGTLIEVTGLSKRYHRMEVEATVVVPEVTVRVWV